MLVPGLLLLLVLALLVIESVAVHKKVHSLSVRCHVNGTRGKSSVTRYIAAAMRASGKRTWAKVTGVTPTYIYPDGETRRVVRRGGARVQEQFATIRKSAADNADCLVLECMSIKPEFQLLECRFFRPHIQVLTNVKDDHREQLGDTLEQQIRSLCEAIPWRATIVTIRGDHLPVLNDIAKERSSKVVLADDLTHEQSSLLPEGVFAENVRLALTACVEAGIDPHEAFAAIIREAGGTDRGTARRAVDGQYVFVDGFAVNDVPSAEIFIEYWRDRHRNKSRLAVIFNARADRPIRSEVFAKYLATVSGLDRVVLVGRHAPYMKRALNSSGFDPDRVVRWSARDVQSARTRLTDIGVTEDFLVIGLGNIGGEGFGVARALTGEVERAV